MTGIIGESLAGSGAILDDIQQAKEILNAQKLSQLKAMNNPLIPPAETLPPIQLSSPLAPPIAQPSQSAPFTQSFPFT